LSEDDRVRLPSWTFVSFVVHGLAGARIVNRYEKTCAKINGRFLPHERRLCCAASAVQVFRMVLNPVPRAERLSARSPMALQSQWQSFPFAPDVEVACPKGRSSA